MMRHAKKSVTNENYTADDMDKLRAGVAKLPL
jgi:hypothetical protein